ncbi:FAD-dependent oxidoreductase [Bacteroides sp. 519]|uniref:FAD-dependent oxidoreductase n=1 Tax=Bacteroides sp. 519 TaxID=2302937 RepID=UPI0013D3E262|nr:FAD-dependent oxidoreductase [Bacteroides sp. 519]NDV60748.1 FAD-dependent oxidoreductase [Bacteroides sp. 519]
MERRKFLRNAGILGLASVAGNTLSAAETPTSQVSSRKAGIKVNDQWDVIVVGGGPAGCAAATAAAREGAKTLLIEGTGALGGMGTSGLLNAWCPFTDKEKIIYKGIAEKVFLESKKGVPHVRSNDWVPINSEYLKVVYDDLVMSEGVSVLFFTTMAAVEMKQEGIVDAIIVGNKAGLTAYKAKLFIDCTGDGDLAAWAGAKFDIGDDKGAVQEGTLCFTLANVDPYEFSLIGSVHSNRKDGPIYKMLDSGKYNLIKDNHINDKYTGPGYLSFNAGHVTVDSTDPASLSSAMMNGRKIARQFQEGLAEFEPKTFASSYLASTAALMGIRESRRIKCDYTFTVDDWVARKEFDDSIGRNSYYIDIHKSNAKEYQRYGKGESHGIPFRTLLPVGLKNVFVAGRCISTDHYAHGSLRVMPPCLVTGEAVGVAAGQIYKSQKPDVHNVDTAKLRNRLKKVGQLL